MLSSATGAPPPTVSKDVIFCLFFRYANIAGGITKDIKYCTINSINYETSMSVIRVTHRDFSEGQASVTVILFEIMILMLVEISRYKCLCSFIPCGLISAGIQCYKLVQTQVTSLCMH